MTKSRGFSAIEVLVGVAAIVLIGLVGYNLYSMQQAKDASVAEQQSAAQEQDIPEVPEINSTQDLDEAEQLLDSVNPDENANAVTELDTEAAF